MFEEGIVPEPVEELGVDENGDETDEAQSDVDCQPWVCSAIFFMNPIHPLLLTIV